MSGEPSPPGLGELARSCAQPAIETDAGLCIRGLNQAARAYFGYPLQEVAGQPLFQSFILPNDGRPAPAPGGGPESRLCKARLQNGRAAYLVLTDIPLADGGRLFLACDVTNQYNDHCDLANKRAIYIMVSSITSRLLETRSQDLLQEMGGMMHTISMFLGAQCSYLARVGAAAGQSRLLGCWCQEPEQELKQDQLRDLLAGAPEFLSRLGQLKTVHQTTRESLEDLEAPAPGEEYLARRGAGAVIAVPLVMEERLLGFLACERHQAAQGWPPDEVMMLRTLAEALSSALARLDAEEKLREQTQFLTLLAETVQTGVMVSNIDDERVFTINKYGHQLIGAERREIVGLPRSSFLERSDQGQATGRENEPEMESSEWVLRTSSGRRVNVLRTAARADNRDAGYLVECFSDISALKKLMEEQTLDIGLAKRLLDLVEGERPRHLALAGGRGLFVTAIALSCMAEGGDHYFVKELGSGADQGRVAISLKDQSGHQVGCMLRSILTDVLHQHLLGRDQGSDPAGVVTRLNDLLSGHELMAADDFLTAITCQVERASGAMTFVSCGHPRFLHIRGEEVRLLPGGTGEAGANLPLGFMAGRRFSAGHLDLETGDRIVLYTDGLLEALGEAGAYRSSDLADLVAALVAARPAMGVQALLRRLLAEASSRGGRLLTPEGINQSEDDVTLIGLEVEDWAWQGEEVWRPADLAQLQGLMDAYFAARESEWDRLGFAKSMRLRICLEEAVANAFRHGNRSEPGAAITLRHRYGNDFHLQVSDSGPGFDWAASPGLDRVADPRRESGRGIFLLRKMTSHLAWNQAGNQVEMAFSRWEEGPPPTSRPSGLDPLF